MLFGHSTWDAVTTSVHGAEPDLTKVVDYPGKVSFTKFHVTDLGITPESTRGQIRQGIPLRSPPERQVEVHISGPEPASRSRPPRIR